MRDAIARPWRIVRTWRPWRFGRRQEVTAWVAIVVAVASVLFSWWSTRSQLDLAQTQLDAALRPILVPVGAPQTQADESGVRITLRNVGNGTTVAGFLALAPSGPLDPSEAKAYTSVPLPSCREIEPRGADYNHMSWSPIPPLAAREQTTVELRLNYGYIGFGIDWGCYAAAYLDVTGRQWVSDWVEGVFPQSPAGPDQLQTYERQGSAWFATGVPELSAGPP